MNSEALVMSTISAEAFTMVNKKMMRFFKGDGSSGVFLSELLSAYKYHLNNQSAEPDGAFPIPTKRYSILLGFSAYKQDRMIKVLESMGFAQVRLQGFPAMKYISLNFDTIARVLSADDIMDHKKVEKAEFYQRLNEALNDNAFTKSSILAVEEACDNMQAVLRGTIILMSRDFIQLGKEVTWDSPTVGRITNWVRKRSLGKAFDFSVVTRTLKAVSVLPDTTFEQFVKAFMVTAKGVQDVHYLRQVLDYNELLT